MFDYLREMSNEACQSKKNASKVVTSLSKKPTDFTSNKAMRYKLSIGNFDFSSFEPNLTHQSFWNYFWRIPLSS